MQVSIKLKPGVKGYRIIKKKCANCGAIFMFRLANNEVQDVIGEAYNYPEEKTVRCKVCLSTFKYEVFHVEPHVGFGKEKG